MLDKIVNIVIRFLVRTILSVFGFKCLVSVIKSDARILWQPKIFWTESWRAEIIDWNDDV